MAQHKTNVQRRKLENVTYAALKSYRTREFSAEVRASSNRVLEHSKTQRTGQSTVADDVAQLCVKQRAELALQLARSHLRCSRLPTKGTRNFLKWPPRLEVFLRCKTTSTSYCPLLIVSQWASNEHFPFFTSATSSFVRLFRAVTNSRYSLQLCSIEPSLLPRRLFPQKEARSIKGRTREQQG